MPLWSHPVISNVTPSHKVNISWTQTLTLNLSLWACDLQKSERVFEPGSFKIWQLHSGSKRTPPFPHTLSHTNCTCRVQYRRVAQNTSCVWSEDGKTMAGLLDWIDSVFSGASWTYIELFCGEGSDSHPGGVSLWHTEHITDIQRRDPKASACPANSAVWWCHKRICAYREKILMHKLIKVQIK